MTLEDLSSRLNHTSYRKFYFIDFVQNFLHCNFGTFNSKFGSFHSAISQILHPRLKVLIPSLKTVYNQSYIRISCFFSEAERSKFRSVCGFHSRWPMGIQIHFFLSNLIKPGSKNPDMGAWYRIYLVMQKSIRWRQTRLFSSILPISTYFRVKLVIDRLLFNQLYFRGNRAQFLCYQFFSDFRNFL